MTDLTPTVAQTITDPVSGEIIDRGNTDRVVEARQRIVDYLKQWQGVKAWCDEAIIEAADAQSKWTFEIGGQKIEVSPPNTASIDWDMDELHKLEAIVPADRYAELVVQTVSEKAITGKLQALARQSGADSVVWKIITAAERRRPKARGVRVSR